MRQGVSTFHANSDLQAAVIAKANKQIKKREKKQLNQKNTWFSL